MVLVVGLSVHCYDNGRYIAGVCPLCLVFWLYVVMRTVEYSVVMCIHGLYVEAYDQSGGR